MKIRICYIFWGLALLFLMGNIPLSAQLQFSGKPLGIGSGLKAADVLYHGVRHIDVECINEPADNRSSERAFDTGKEEHCT